MTAILLVGVAVLSASWSHRPPREAEPPAQQQQRLPPKGSSARAQLEWCRENVSIVHDVHWASACRFRADDDSPECTLPDEQALPLNEARARAEQDCLDEALALR